MNEPTEAPLVQDPRLLRRLLRAKDRIDAASHEHWPVARLARVSGVSQAHFARAFRQAFGMPPHRYLLTRRVERAAALLRETSASVTDVALQFRWLTVQYPGQDGVQLGLFKPGAPMVDDATAQMLDAAVAKGAMPPLVLSVKDCRAAHAELQARGVEFTQEPVERYGAVDASFRDPSGNGWKLVER